MPQINEIAHGQDIGKKAGYDYIFLSCSMCNKPRWVKTILVSHPNYKNICRDGCQQRVRAYHNHSFNNLYWDGKSELIINMQKSSTELLKMGVKIPDYNNSMMEWHECPQCKDRYWRALRSNGRKTNSPICFKCTRINNGKMMQGERSPQWKGGRRIDKASGYINLRVNPDNPYYEMSDNGRIREHRLVIAQSLGRLLQPYEVVHHKGTLYPQGSNEDKQDNRIENLELLNPITHLPHSRLSLRVKQLEIENGLLKEELAELKSKIK